MKLIVSNSEDVGRWVAKKTFSTWQGEPSIGLSKDGEVIAGVLYEKWNKRSVTCHIAVQGLLTPAYLAAIFHYPFVYLGASKIIAPVAESNEESVKFVKKLGFQEEARLHDAHPDGSILFMTMTQDKCRFIGKRYGLRLAITAARA